MSLQKRKRVVRQLMLSLWAMFTFVLLFCVVLLVREMIQNGVNPLARLTQKSVDTATATSPQEGDNAADITSKEILLYFINSAHTGLSGELRLLQQTDSTLDNCRIALDALIAGPVEDGRPLLPQETAVRAMYLIDGGELVVDFSREILKGAELANDVFLETLLVYGLTNTLSHPVLTGRDSIRVQSVRFLLEGSAPEDFFPAHLDLTYPIHPDPRWIADENESRNHG